MNTLANPILSEALAAFKAGKHSLAEQKCNAVLQQHPGHGEAYNLLGVMAQASGQSEQAIEYLRLALKGEPNNHRIISNIGKILVQLGRDDEAEAQLKESCRLDPGYGPSCTNLAKLYRKQKRYDEARQLLNRFLETAPADLSANNLLGSILTLQGQEEEALKVFQKAVQAHPGNTVLHFNIGNIHLGTENYPAAIDAYSRALVLDKSYHPARLALGHAYRRNKDIAQARKIYQKTIQLKPDLAEAWYSLAGLILHEGDNELALKYMHRALELDPLHAHAWVESANIFINLGQQPEAKNCLERAVQIKPDFEEALFMLAKILILDNELGQAAAILENLQQGQDIRTDLYFNELALLRLRNADWQAYATATARYVDIAQAPSDKLICPPPLSLNYFPIEPHHHLALAKKYSHRIESAAPALLNGKKFKWKKKTDQEKIRIGYISPDFRQHSVGILLNSAFQHHDRARTEIYLYHLVSLEDDITSTFKANADVFRNLSSFSYLKAAEIIHQDQIDILIDLAGYTTHSRTAILALRPAPLQLHFMGFPGSMGAPFISGIIADRWLASEADQKNYAEKILHIPNAFFTSPIPMAPAAPSRSELGLPESSFVFCCFNAVYKISPPVFKAWAQILNQVENGVLWLSGTHETAQRNLIAAARQHGIDPARLVFATKRPLEDYMASYAAADLFLDTFHYSAGSTAVCALYAGTPLLTLAGNTNASRMGASISAAAGVEETIVFSADEYIQKAVYYSRHGAELALLRNRLKSRQGKLFDPAASIKNLEAVCIQAYQQLEI